MTGPIRLRYLMAACAIGTSLWLGGCAAVPPQSPGVTSAEAVRLDAAPRVAVLTAFAPEIVLLRKQLQDPVSHQVHGVEFITGQLAGRPVVLFLSGISMVNAAMNTQRVLDHFNVKALVFSGIAGGVNPGLHIGDVTVPQQWGQYLEVLMARETAPGKYSAPGFMKDPMFPNYGMLFPRGVEVLTSEKPEVHRKFWFEVDPNMLATARNLQVGLAACTAPGKCLTSPPKLVVGGNGVSGQAFMDNAAFRDYTFKTFEANVLDMETAAVGQVAYSNRVPYIAFRSLSDLAGGGEGENEMGTFFGLAADNSAKVLMAFLAAWKP